MNYRFLLAFVALLTACDDPSGLRLTPAGDGPQVYIDWDADPLPEIPFPIDLATRPDPESPTGLRLNFSEVSDTEAETQARERVNEMTGFGIYAPISVRFRSRLDLANIVARQADDYDSSDDAIYVINVDESSPSFGAIVDLDFDHGRFPGDAFSPGSYFENDPRSTEPSLLYDTAFEDCNRNGILDPGEDTDSDGVLDVPNIYPPFDPASERHPVFCPADADNPDLTVRDVREDLMNFYEYETETLIFRPVVPMKEMTRYAVVLTDRLVDEAGNPVRSPWEWINHTRQTDALRPLEALLPDLGLSLGNVAFAWTFTTGDITGDLSKVRQGLDGEGPFGWLAEAFPASVVEPDRVWEGVSVDNVYAMPMSSITNTLTTLGLFPANAEEVLLQGYDNADYLVGGKFITPNFLVDRDDAPLDDEGNPIESLADSTDEAWEINPATGEAIVGTEEIWFTCVIPKPREGFEAPFPATFFGHGYGSSRFDFLGFAWAMNKVGHAACAIDFPSHGPTLSEGDRQEYEPILESVGMLPFVDHLFKSRYDDLDNDQEGDSGADQWISDGFHTADMVRQAVVDWSQMIRAFEQCGIADWDVDVNGDGVNETSCDWNGDGVPDVGGPDNTYGLMGGSLGGINAAVAAAVEPKFSASAPIVAGGGFMDIGWRSALSGVRQAVPGRVMSPFFLTRQDAETGDWVVAQQLMSGRRDKTRNFGRLSGPPPAGGQLQVTNLRTGEVRQAWFGPDGLTRLGIPADALDGPEKRVYLGMPGFGDTIPLGAPTVYSADDNEELGDPMIVEILNADGQVVQTIDTFELEVVHEGATYPTGSKLVALAEGLGHTRATPRLRRIVNVLALVTEKGDPISYAPKYWLDDPLPSMGRDTRVLLYPTPGDEIVCVAAEFAMGRAAGLWDWKTEDPRYGMSVDHWLIDVGAIRGDERFGPWRDRVGRHVLFDIDDLDNSTDGTSAPSHAPLRVSTDVDGGVSGMRAPYVDIRGSHGWLFPDTEMEFDINTFSTMQAAWYIATEGTDLSDDPCFEDMSCDFLPTLEAR